MAADPDPEAAAAGDHQSKAATSTMMLTDAWEDWKGRPAVRVSSGGWSAAAMILVVELNERLTTLSVAVNLVTYLTDTMRLGSAASANAVTNFLGASFLLCLLGGVVADTCLGRYRTIAISTALQAAGMAILTATTASRARAQLLGVLYLGLYLTARGTGGLKSSVSGFGSDQFDESDDGERRRMARFFDWFFFFISIGSLLAVTVLVYVQDHLGRPWGYGACVAAILLGLLLFLAGTPRYRFKTKKSGAGRSPLKQIAAVAAAAAWGRKRNTATPTVTDTEVEEVKQLLRMLPTWATTIPFWTVYAQMTTFSVSQAQAMDRRLGSFRIPAGSLTAFFVASVLLTVPVYDRFLLPLARRFTANPHGLSPHQRIFLGLLLSALAMVAAAVTERARRSAAGATSVFLLVPQFLLVGAGEAFVYIGQLVFFLRECPRGMKAVSTGLFLTTISLGFFFSTAIVSAVNAATTSGGRRPGGWLTDDLDQGSLHNFYWLLAAISAVNLLAFMAAARGYVYMDKRLLATAAAGGQ